MIEIMPRAAGARSLVNRATQCGAQVAIGREPGVTAHITNNDDCDHYFVPTIAKVPTIIQIISSFHYEATMFPFSQNITPAAKTHVQAQVSFFNDLTRSLFQTAQQVSELNLQLAQTVLEDTTSTSQAMITADKPTEVFSVTASRAQPAADRLRSYQQQLSRIAADTQTKLIRVAGEHAEETARAAREFTDEVTRITSEETERTLRQQQDTMRQLANPLDTMVDSAARQARAAMGNGHDVADHAAQSASQAAQAAQAAARQGTGARKEGQPS